MRTLAFVILQFFVVVVLPNDVGTPELPAVGARRVAAKAICRSISPSKDRLSTTILAVRFGHPFDVSRAAFEFPNGLLTQSTALQLSPRLRI